MSSWAAALRIARRDAWRAKGRSALVIAMIALPVLGVSAIDVLVRTDELSPEQAATRLMGAADAVLSDSGLASFDQFGVQGVAGRERPGGSAVDLTTGLPPGSRVLPDASVQGRVSVPGLATSATLRELAYDDPLAAGLYLQVAGRVPAGPGEVVVTTGLAQRLGVGVGSQVVLRADGPAATVVGTVTDGSSRTARTALLAAGTLDGADEQVQRSALVDVPGTLDADVVRAVNATGTYVQPRTSPVPGAPPEPAGGTDVRALAVVVLVAGMALLEVVLLAGPAGPAGSSPCWPRPVRSGGTCAAPCSPAASCSAPSAACSASDSGSAPAASARGSPPATWTPCPDRSTCGRSRWRSSPWSAWRRPCWRPRCLPGRRAGRTSSPRSPDGAGS